MKQDQHRPIYPLHNLQGRPKSFRFRLLCTILLLSTASFLSLILPTPWSFLDPSRYTRLILPNNLVADQADPADSFKDDIWPIRTFVKSWDISTDYPYPRTLEYDVEEGTWLRLDVHPSSGDIVFDMLGDIYCIPASEAYVQRDGEKARARPVLLGVPYDADPHFSPDGSQLVFRSDAELGVENIWVLPWSEQGCVAMDVRPPTSLLYFQETYMPLYAALRVKDEEEKMLAEGVKETPVRKRKRLRREGRINAHRVTNETYRYLTDPRFHPSGQSIIATKWYTSSRSIGAGEGWLYNLSSSPGTQIGVGSGQRVVGRILPPGWDTSSYPNQQIGPEQFIFNGNDTIIYAKNVVDQSSFEYSKDTHAGIYSIFSYNLTSGKTETLVGASPGGPSRPEISRDGRTLAFVRRFRDYGALVLKDLKTGTIQHIYHGLNYDLGNIAAPMGTYPSFTFSPSSTSSSSNSTSIIIWAAGQIHSIPLSTNNLGELVSHPTLKPFPVRFTAHVELKLAETRREEFDLRRTETRDEMRVSAFKSLASADGGRVVFQAAGKTYVQELPGAGEDGKTPPKPKRVPVLHDDPPYYSPSFIQFPYSDDHPLVIHSRWSDTNLTSFEIADLEHDKAYEVDGLPLGRYLNPTVAGTPNGRARIAFVKTGGDRLTGDVFVVGGVGLHVGELDVSPGKEKKNPKIVNHTFIPSEIDTTDQQLVLRFTNEKAEKLLVQQSRRVFVIDLDGARDGDGKPPHSELVSARMASEVGVPLSFPNISIPSSPSATPSANAAAASQNDDDKAVYDIAWIDFMQIYVASSSSLNTTSEPLWSKPGNATKGLIRVSLDGGHDLSFSPSGKTLFWFLGPYLHYLDLSSLAQCASAAEEDTQNFGIGCVKEKGLVKWVEVEVWHSTDIKRLKDEAVSSFIDAHTLPMIYLNPNTSKQTERVETKAMNLANAGVFIIYNATVLSMETGDLERDLVRHAVVRLRGGLIESVIGGGGGEGEEFGKGDVPEGVDAINAEGGLVLPGFLDVHAHWGGYASPHPAKSWEMETFLAYGVTTLHNPSASSRDTFNERSRLESGQFIGPRIFQTGEVIYGAADEGLHQDIVDLDEARSALLRIKLEGGESATSYKNYQLPSRASRQMLLLQAKELKMLCVPEGGMNYDWDLTYIQDGMTTVEHAIPTPVLYEDVLKFFALSGTGNTPTHIVSYGGAFGEQLLWATHDIPNDPKLRRFNPHYNLEEVAESHARPVTSYALFNTSASLAKAVEIARENNATFRAHIGAHGENPLGIMYHTELLYTAGAGYRKGIRSGKGLSNYDTLQAATSWAAQTFGFFNSLGSVTPGKLADLVVYPPGVHLLNGTAGLERSQELRYVIRGGRVWDAESMEQVWPLKKKKQVMPKFNAD